MDFLEHNISNRKISLTFAMSQCVRSACFSLSLCNTVHGASEIIEARASEWERAPGRIYVFARRAARSKFHNGKKGRRSTLAHALSPIYFSWGNCLCCRSLCSPVIILHHYCEQVPSLYFASCAAAAISFFLTIVTPPKTTTCARRGAYVHAAAKVSARDAILNSGAART